jgi:hypothetical protein
MGRKRTWWSKKAEKEYERRERELAEEKTKGRGESDYRQATIKTRWDLDEKKIKAAKTYNEKRAIERQLKREKLGELQKFVRSSIENDQIVDGVDELIELAGLQDREIEYLMQFRRDWEQIEAHFPDQLDNLHGTSVLAQLQLLPKQLLAQQAPKNWEDKRQRYKLPNGGGLIEYEFGGAGEAEWRKTSLSLLGLPYNPTCLDKIFADSSVKMHESGEGNPREHGLQNLFGMHRNRFPKNLQGKKDGREKWYDYLDVVKIMHFFLSEKPRKKCKRRGRSPRKPWLIDSEKRIRVLTRIVARMDSLSVSQGVWDAFTAVVCYHLTNGRPQREDIKQQLAPLVRRYLQDSAKK